MTIHCRRKGQGGVSMHFTNPVITGFNPDPSICKVGEDYYIVTSTFEYFPGVPIYHSRNLVNWELIGHVLTRRGQDELAGCKPSGGIYAPTLRYHDGMFYMITTNVNFFESHQPVNFIVHSESITGPWSDPVFTEQMGIDPSLFFDDDGSCYFTGTGDENRIVLYKINPMTGERLSEKKTISHGSGGRCPEGPHIYKKDGWYYLFMAQGGTEYGHSEIVARSRNIEGPYEYAPYAALITSRNDSMNEIQCTGHADLTSDDNGNWWLVCLGVRPINGVMLHHIGRETCLAPVSWYEEWPVVKGAEVLPTYENVPLPYADTVRNIGHELRLDFTEISELPLDFTYLRNPDMENYVFDYSLVLRGSYTELLSTANTSPTFTGIRQTEMQMSADARVSTDVAEGTVGGLTIYQTHRHHYDIAVTKKNGLVYCILRKHIYDIEQIVARVPVEGEAVKLQIVSDGRVYRFYVKDSAGDIYLGGALTAGLATEITETMTFTGTFIGMFAEKGYVRFTDFNYYGPAHL